MRANSGSNGLPDDTFVNALTSSAPNFIWLTPNLCDDMHDSCSSPYNSNRIAQGNNTLSTLVPQILNSPLFLNTRAALFITFDEGTRSCPSSPTANDCVYAVISGPQANKQYHSSTVYNPGHYSWLSTIEHNWQLACLVSVNTYNDCNRSPMSEFFIQDFSMSANPNSLSIPQGGSVNTSITVSSLNLFSNTVTLSAGLSPQNSHFSVCFNGYSCTSTASTSVVVPSGGSASATLTVNAGCYAVPGSYNVQVNGTFSSPSILRSILIPMTVTSFTCSVGSVGAGTLITLADRTSIPVQNLKVGMRLLSYNMTTHQYVNTTTTRFVTVVTYNQMVISTSTGKPLVVDQNPAQKLYAQLPDGTVSLVSVTDLQMGYKLFQPLSQTWVSIINIQYQNSGIHTMYDIYTTAPGNYIANNYLDPLKDGPH